MKNGNNSLKIVLTGIILVSMVFGAIAQTTKKNQVKVKVITSDGGKVVDMDTTFNHDVFVFQSDGNTKVINLDSIMEGHHHDMDKHMRVMAFKMDSLNDFNFEFDGDVEKMHIEMEKLLKEKGIMLEEMGHASKGGNRMVIMQSGGAEVDIEEFINDEGDHVKIIKKEIHGDEDGKHEVKTFVIASDTHDMPMAWKEKNEYHSTVKVESIPLEDISFLNELGVSTKKLMSEPLDLNSLKVKFEKIMEDDKLQTLVHIECELPAGDFQMQLFNQEGEKVKEESDIKSGVFKQELDLKEEEAPYYYILSKNNQLFGRKIVL
ncbi:hypothetical protein [Carboxylicivirga sp. M1479]|uniref:hypothetical protein n=1 Tax=Carboxylicivirga sp. M1479 TaxID=2594476 RepID=UPI001178C2D3|nr:hypothetical protein [Carboxylicivirga sp. M1479]TRX70317.1 hypothetical protein FNN09_12605 [Carboxylicivirga sp. M1479]